MPVVGHDIAGMRTVNMVKLKRKFVGSPKPVFISSKIVQNKNPSFINFIDFLGTYIKKVNIVLLFAIITQVIYKMQSYNKNIVRTGVVRT